MVSSRIRTRHAALELESLEGRDVPTIIAPVGVAFSATGLMTLTGDDNDSRLTLKLESNQITITTDANTDVGFGVSASHTFPNTVTSLKADMKGGNDAILIDGASDFKLTGSATFLLGDGNNTLDMTTTQAVELGSLSVKAGDGLDIITLSPGAGLGAVAGATIMSLGSGTALVTLKETTFSGPTGVKVGVTLTGNIVLNTNNTFVDKTLAVKNGNTTASTALTGGSFGALSATGRFADMSLFSTTVNGRVSSNGNDSAKLVVSDATVTGDIALKAAKDASLVLTTGTFVANNITISSGVNATVVIGSFSPALTSTTTINGNLSLSAKTQTAMIFKSTGVSEVKGRISMKGGNYSNVFSANERFQADKDVSIIFGDGTNDVTVGTGTAGTAAIVGRLTIKGGKGVDSVTFKNAAVAGATNISLGAGADQLVVDLGSSFAGTVTVDMGSGDDLVSMAQSTGAAAQVFFTGKTTIKTGAGNDALALGKGTGDANSQVNFTVPGSNIDGGAGVNRFDDGTAMLYTGLVFNTSIINFVDPL